MASFEIPTSGRFPVRSVAVPWGSGEVIRSLRTRSIEQTHLVVGSQRLPALQDQRDVPVQAQRIVKAPERKCLPLAKAGLGEQLLDLELAGLVADGLAGLRRERRRFNLCRADVHRAALHQVIGRLRQRHLPQR